MKKIFFLLLVVIGLQSIAQDTKKPVPILISAQGKTVDAFLDSNNAKKILTLTIEDNKDARLSIAHANAKNESAFNRSFTLVNDKDEDLKLSFTSRRVGVINLQLNDFFAKAKKGKTYKIYTIAIPKDPAVAATVRVRRILLCSIMVK